MFRKIVLVVIINTGLEPRRRIREGSSMAFWGYFGKKIVKRWMGDVFIVTIFGR